MEKIKKNDYEEMLKCKKSGEEIIKKGNVAEQKNLSKYIVAIEPLNNVKRSWWFKITKKQWFGAWKGLIPMQRSVLMSLHLYAGKKSFCYPSVRRLADDLGVSTKTILRNIRILQKKEFIRIEKHISQKGKINTYFLLK